MDDRATLKSVKSILYLVAIVGSFAVAFAACASAQTDATVRQDDDPASPPPASAEPSGSPATPATSPTPPADHPQPVS